MLSVATILTTAADDISYHGLHQNPAVAHFVDTHGRLDLAGALYRAATGTTPTEAADFTPDFMNLAIRTHDAAMEAIRWTSAAIEIRTQVGPPLTNGHPDYIEHITRWGEGTAIFQTQPPLVCEVIGLLHRAARLTHPHTTPALAA
ncbi:hypothetical protein [Streptomyces sp. NPDC017529]|uniref:DUF6197 family protein n=1 Tax=Streptomyces sp. NPDC017529 TaxID=3365000 RepID=UPI003791F312